MWKIPWLRGEQDRSVRVAARRTSPPTASQDSNHNVDRLACGALAKLAAVNDGWAVRGQNIAARTNAIAREWNGSARLLDALAGRETPR